MNIICTFISSFPAKFNSYIHSLSHYSLLSKGDSKQTKRGNEDCEKIWVVLGLCNFYKETKTISLWTQSHSQPPFSEHGLQIRTLSLWFWSISLGNNSNWKYCWSIMLLPLPGWWKAAEWTGIRARETHPPPGGLILGLMRNSFCKDTPNSWETKHLSFFNWLHDEVRICNTGGERSIVRHKWIVKYHWGSRKDPTPWNGKHYPLSYTGRDGFNFSVP